MKIEIQVREIGNSNGIILPKLYCEHLNVQSGDIIIIEDEEGKHGKFISMWKKK